MRQNILRAALLLIAAGCLQVQPAHADNPLDAQWWGGFGLPIKNGEVHAVCVYGGQMVVGGWFTQAGTTHARHVAAWNGSGWDALGSGVPLGVEALTIYNGQLIAAGTTFGATAEFPTVHAWNGSAWTAIGSTSGTVSALAVYNGELYAGGDFTTVNGTAASRVARWNGTQWLPAGGGITGVGSVTVRALTVHDGKLVAGGSFSGLNSVAAWDGATWTQVGAGLQYNGGAAAVYALSVVGGELYAGGKAISHSGATAVADLSKWNGSSWVGVTGGDQLALGEWNGFPMGSNGVQTARWNGSSWTADGSPAMPPRAFFTEQGVLHVGGLIGLSVDGLLRYDGVSWTAPMQAWSQGMSGLFGPVSSLISFDGELHVVSSGLRAGAEDHWVTLANVARWSGSSWTSVPGLPHAPYALATYGNALVATVNGGNRVYRLQGGVWSQLGGSANDWLYELAEHGADLVVVGDFTTFGGAPAPGVARWNGSAWSGLGAGIDPLAGSPQTVISHGGEIVVGGYFTTVAGGPGDHLVRWDGSAFQPLGGGTDGPVYALGHFGFDLVVGGDFQHAGGVATPGAALWNGSSWTPLGDNAEYVLDFVEHAGRLYATGEFVDDDGREIYGAAVWTGERWYPLGSGVDGYASTLAFVGDDLYLGGGFGWAYGKSSFNVAWLPNASTVGVYDPPQVAALSLSASPNPTRGPVRLTGSLPRAGRVRLTVHDLGGRVIAVLADGEREAGAFSLTWAGEASPGLYFATLDAAGARRTVRLARYR